MAELPVGSVTVMLITWKIMRVKSDSFLQLRNANEDLTLVVVMIVSFRIRTNQKLLPSLGL